MTGLHLIARLHHLRRMLHAPRPGHLADVDETFDSRLQLHKSAVVGDVDHPPDHPSVHRIPLRDGFPGVRLQLLDAQRNAFLALFELEYFDGDLIAHVQHLRRMRDAAVRHVGNMQQSVDAAQVDKRAIFGEVLHRAGDHRTFHQMFQRGALADVDFFFHRRLTRNHHVAAAPVELDNLDRYILPDEQIQIVHWARIGLRAGHEGADSHVHREPAFHPSQHAA